MASQLNQCISAKTQNQIDHCDESKKDLFVLRFYGPVNS